ncbi:M23 family metallopeptidase [Caldibacillus debilis]|uniref:Membrane-bound metallopeptidase n=1 Tax=Caldibacillus debilis GB1 TaxID=1339248 RepID=A0A420VBV9_9BACI|nr:M23 family metallopeptidase [Caldibacillus debilis]RKO61094.1 Membrane-bound metallopeptidase [Caldibacillus debilis GB1]
MGNRRKELLKRMEKRRREMMRRQGRTVAQMPVPDYEDPFFAGGKEKSFLPRKEVFLFKIFASVLLVFLTAFIFKHPSEKLEPVRRGIGKAMETEFRFAAVSQWYEKTFGNPLALLPDGNGKKDSAGQYALPASARIVEGFQHDNRGVIIRTDKETPVEAIKKGVVIFTGEKDNLGKTVIVQHPDNTESWYGHLGEISVRIYEEVEAGEAVGAVSAAENEDSGEFYFALKKGEQFIDPIQVIKFE